jgi:hypothetical protein
MNRSSGADGGGHHLLVVASAPVIGSALERELQRRVEGRRTEVLVLSPAMTGSALKHAFGDVDEAIVSARERLEASVGELSHSGIAATGTVGDSDPLIAIEDALATFPADEILIVTSADQDEWLDGDLFENARGRFRQPLTVVESKREPGGDTGIARRERAGAGIEAEDESRRETVGHNFPPLTIANVGGIIVAIVGTIVLVILAATCTGSQVGGDSTNTGCVVRYFLAGIVGLVNVAHVVGLMLFESVPYHGFWQRFFARLSLFGTPAAIIASLLVD